MQRIKEFYFYVVNGIGKLLFVYAKTLPRQLSFLLGLTIGFISIDSKTGKFLDFTPAQKMLFTVSIVTLTSILIVVLYKLYMYFFGKSFIHYRSEVYKLNTDEAIRKVANKRLSWGTSIELDLSPLSHGWSFDDIMFRYDPVEYKFDEQLEKEYIKYFHEVYKKERVDQFGNVRDDARVMVTGYSRSHTHRKKLELELKKTKYSRVKFANLLYQKDLLRYTAEILNSRFKLTNTFYLAIFIHTRDRKIFRQRVSVSSDHGPNEFAVSIGEQQEPNDNDLLTWVKRALTEELNLSINDDYDATNIYFSAIHLDTHDGNIGLSCQVKLNITSCELTDSINYRPIIDANEIEDWDYLHWEELVYELVNPVEKYQSNMGLRMLLAGLGHWPHQILEKKLYDAKQSRKAGKKFSGEKEKDEVASRPFWTKIIKRFKGKHKPINVSI